MTRGRGTALLAEIERQRTLRELEPGHSSGLQTRWKAYVAAGDMESHNGGLILKMWQTRLLQNLNQSEESNNNMKITDIKVEEVVWKWFLVL